MCYDTRTPGLGSAASTHTDGFPAPHPPTHLPCLKPHGGHSVLTLVSRVVPAVGHKPTHRTCTLRRTQTNTHTPATHMCTHATPTHMHTYLHTCTHTYTPYTHIHTMLHLHTCAHMCTHTPHSTHTCTHTHTYHTQLPTYGLLPPHKGTPPGRSPGVQ